MAGRPRRGTAEPHPGLAARDAREEEGVRQAGVRQAEGRPSQGAVRPAARLVRPRRRTGRLHGSADHVACHHGAGMRHVAVRRRFRVADDRSAARSAPVHRRHRLRRPAELVHPSPLHLQPVPVHARHAGPGQVHPRQPDADRAERDRRRPPGPRRPQARLRRHRARAGRPGDLHRPGPGRHQRPRPGRHGRGGRPDRRRGGRGPQGRDARPGAQHGRRAGHHRARPAHGRPRAVGALRGPAPPARPHPRGPCAAPARPAADPRRGPRPGARGHPGPR
ncbi:hypothetical protein SFUMM280S_04003 [Streptomyces fumanus]